MPSARVGFARRQAQQSRTNSRKTKQRRDDYTFLPFEQTLATSQNIPYPDLILPIRNQAYLARSGRAFPSGIDPNWDREYVFEGHIRAPFDERAQKLGLFPNAHIYEVNPLAGRGTDNESFLAADPLGNEGVQNDIDAVNGQMSLPTQVNTLDPAQMANAAINQRLNDPIQNALLNPEQQQNIENLRKKLATTAEMDKNILLSRGYDMVQDPRGNHALTNRNGHAIAYYVSDELQEIEAEEDPIEKDQVNYHFSTDYWMNWYGYKLNLKTPQVADTNELMHCGSEFMRIIKGVDLSEQAFTMEHRGMYPDAEIAPDHLSLLAYESTPGNPEQAARDEETEIRARELADYNF